MMKLPKDTCMMRRSGEAYVDVRGLVSEHLGSLHLQHNGALAEAFGAVPVSLVNKYLGLCKYVFRTGVLFAQVDTYFSTRYTFSGMHSIYLIHRPSSEGVMVCHINTGFAMHPGLEHA